MDWYEKMWRYSVELFRSLEIPVRQLECCSGDLADLKVKSCDIEAWSPRQQKYFEVCSCSNLGDAQARRLKIRVRGEDGKLYLAHTLNNTVVAPPRMLIAFLENHLQRRRQRRYPRGPSSVHGRQGSPRKEVKRKNTAEERNEKWRSHPRSVPPCSSARPAESPAHDRILR